MKCTLTPLKHLIFVTCFLISFLSYAFDSNTTEKQANSSIEELYHRLRSMPNTSMPDRIDWFSSQFLGIPYLLGSLGEGPKARYDQFPKYRVDSFDCDTYVNTVLSLALANSLTSFQQCIKNMRYKNGLVSYLQRNHFQGLDWNQNNQQSGLLKDITLTIKDKNNQPVAQIAEAVINKPNWYAYKTVETIRLEDADKGKEEARLEELKKKGARLEVTSEKVPYLPFTALFPKHNKPDMYLFAQIPHGAIIEIVRPNWDLSQKIGTALNISHLGFAIRHDGQLYFRQASSEYGKVVEVPLIDYLEKALNSPTIKGINVQIVVPTKPLTECKMPV
ncbi:N-acetylmuramoyl-L-alanine amidase-like domain-containing protein [Legionella sp. 227]|uniref:N-acetylmuramoyl-L-alanine amidase-like domain-containing protein n=1 Tax=Legionella sp. 227 TaxID=3367288 RepID=UPI00370D0BFC